MSGALFSEARKIYSECPYAAGLDPGKPGARTLPDGEVHRRNVMNSNGKRAAEMFAFVGVTTCFSSPIARAQLERNALAQTPPMGWNSWNKFACNVSEDLIRSTADAIVSSGMKDAGYEYVVIDDCWQVARDKEGNIIPDPKRFPNGMKALADYIHSKGLKFG